jgi:hypothetical protein
MVGVGETFQAKVGIKVAQESHIVRVAVVNDDVPASHVAQTDDRLLKVVA